MQKIERDQQGAVGPVEIVMIAVIVGLVGFIGWRVYDARQDVSNRAVNPGEIVTIEPLPEDIEGVLEISKVKEIVLNESGESMVDLELKNEDGVLVYEVKLSDGRVLIIDAKTGAVVEYSTDDEDSDESIPADAVIGISVARAIAIAKETHSGAVRKVELEFEDGVVVFSVRFTDGFRVDVNAASGDVTRTKSKNGESKTDKEDDEDDDKDDDSSAKKADDDEYEDDGDDDRQGSRKSGSDDSDDDDSSSDDDDDDDVDEDESESSDDEEDDDQDDPDDN